MKMCEAEEAGDRETFPRWLSSHMMMHRRRTDGPRYTDQRTLNNEGAQNNDRRTKVQADLLR